jgi:hypothetical protein
MIPVETVPRMGRGDKGERWSGLIKLWIIVRNFVNVTMDPLYNNNKNKV